jgi:hypothetical protein
MGPKALKTTETIDKSFLLLYIGSVKQQIKMPMILIIHYNMRRRDE